MKQSWQCCFSTVSNFYIRTTIKWIYCFYWLYISRYFTLLGNVIPKHKHTVSFHGSVVELEMKSKYILKFYFFFLKDLNSSNRIVLFLHTQNMIATWMHFTNIKLCERNHKINNTSTISLIKKDLKINITKVNYPLMHI